MSVEVLKGEVLALGAMASGSRPRVLVSPVRNRLGFNNDSILGYPLPSREAGLVHWRRTRRNVPGILSLANWFLFT